MSKILVIDDKNDNLIAAKALLKALIPECEVFTALSGADGIALAQKELPDTILLDIHMPGMDGFETCRRLKTAERTRHIPIIMLTAIHTDSENHVRTLNLGAEVFLTKPINPEELTAQVNAMLRIKQAEDALRDEKDTLEELVQARTNALRRKTFSLNERVKELNCLYGIGNLVEEPGITLERILQRTVELIPPAWQNPDLTCARILVRGQEFITPNFEATECTQTVPIIVYDTPVGVVEVGCLKKWAESACAPCSKRLFLQEEQNLLNAVAERLGRVIEREETEEALRESEERMRIALEGTEQGLWDWDMVSGEIHFDENWPSVLGYTPGERKFDFAWWEANIHPQSAPVFEKALNAYLEGREPYYELEYQLRDKSGEWRWIWARGICVAYDPQGQPLRMIGTHRDITGRKEAQEALRQSEERFQSLLWSLNDVVWSAAIDDQQVLYINPAAESVYGRPTAEFLENPNLWLEVVHPEDREKIRQDARELFEQGQIESEYRIVRPDGDTRWLHDRKSVIYDANGEPIRIGGIASDITDRKQAEQRQQLVAQILDLLNRSRQKTDSIHDILTLIKHFTGFEAVGIRLKEGDDFPYYVTQGFPEEFVEAERFLCTRNIAGNILRDSQGNSYLECMCGNILCRRTNPALPFFTEQGSFWSNCTTDLLASTTDEDRQTRTRNRCNSEGYESVALIPLRSGDTIIGLIQLNDHRKNRFTPEIITFFEHIGASIGIALVHKKTQDALAAERASLARRVTERTAELSQANELLQQAKDTAEEAQRAAEAARRAAEAASRAKSEFLATMSHELRTPLNAILGFAQVLKADDTLEAHHKERLNTIQSSGEHLLTLITDILDISRIEAGRMELQEQEFHFPSFLNTIVDMIRIQTEQKGIVFAYEKGPNLPDSIRADEKRLRQILLNLLNNAVKFTETGSVTLRVRKLETRQSQVDGESSVSSIQHPVSSIQYPVSSIQYPVSSIQFQVEDTGIGIEPDRLDEVFLPFQQIRDKASYAEGTGLGLTISRRLVELMGAELHVHSAVGQGSRFEFELSLSVVHSVAAGLSAPPRRVVGYTGKRRIVLVADDDAGNRDVLMSLLLPLGFRIAEAENGKDCIEKVLKHAPDIILMDLRMPVMDGFEATERIRNDELRKKHSQTPIIAVTASVFGETRREALADGCTDFLVKPFQQENLLELLHTYLDLEWLYADEPGKTADVKTVTPPEPAALVLPPEATSSLMRFARRGNPKKIFSVLSAIEQQDATYAPAVTTLRAFTKKYQFERIVEMLRHYER